MEKIKLFKTDTERWRFTLYKSHFTNEYYASFPYSPFSFVDTEIFIKFTKEEQTEILDSRDFLIELSDEIRDNHKKYLYRALNFKDFEITDQ